MLPLQQAQKLRAATSDYLKTAFTFIKNGISSQVLQGWWLGRV